MSILVNCGACGRELRAKDDAAGKKAKCPGCQAIIQIPVAEKFADEAEGDGDLRNLPVDEFADDLQPCPACGESVSSTARECRHCGEELQGASSWKKSSRRSSRSSHRQTGEYPTADLGKRFIGKFVDGLASGLSVLPGFGLLIAAATSNDGRGDEQLAIVGVIVILIGVVALFVVQIYLLVAHSQSIGKWMVNTKIMDYETHEPAGFVRSFILRSFLNGLIGSVVPFYSLIDICVIFGEEHRCLHDQIAGTYVVDISE